MNIGPNILSGGPKHFADGAHVWPSPLFYIVFFSKRLLLFYLDFSCRFLAKFDFSCRNMLPLSFSPIMTVLMDL